MTKTKFIYVFAVILYTVIAYISAKFFNIHWIHVFNGLMLSSILYNLLDFKFKCEDVSEEDINE